MSTQRRPRSHIKTLDAVKAGIVVLGLLLALLVVLWVTTRLTQPQAPQPDHTPRPGTSMWEEPAPVP